MSPIPPPESGPDLRAAAQRAARRRRAARQAGEPTLLRQLSTVGVLGWLIVLPALLGLALGRWLDQLLGRGITFSAALLVLGLGLGAWIGWRWIHQTAEGSSTDEP